MQTLKLADDLFPALDAGTKRGTIRAGLRNIELGGLMLVGASNDALRRTVQVVRVSHTMASSLTDADAALDGYDHVSDLYATLQRFYPEMAGSDPVTVIEFRS